MTNEDTTLAKTTCEKPQWLQNICKRWNEVKKESNPELYETLWGLTIVRSISNEKHVFTCLSTLRSGTVKQDLAF